MVGECLEPFGVASLQAPAKEADQNSNNDTQAVWASVLLKERKKKATPYLSRPVTPPYSGVFKDFLENTDVDIP